MIDQAAFQDIVREAGRIAFDRWPGAGNECETWEKSPGNPVSEADLAVDAFLRRELGKLLPAAAWLSEETADDKIRTRSDLIWLVDPIDGTRDYVRGRAGWSVSVALISSGKPLIGMLSAPAREEEWFSFAGRGSTLNGEPLKASTRKEFSGARVPTDQLPSADSDLVAVEKPNSIALRIAMVADNRADLLATLRWGFEWDIAAATLIAREAGAQVSDAFGNPLAYNKHDPRDFGVLVSAPGIHAAAVARLAERAKALK
ncbi:putative myo-inositol monophosphatase 2 family protein [Erythrobacter sp. NAP1]|uniref:3'(2'),5'-bisphosphate nucleotidase CysQ n=1 Tax=Erythrobacter sp. NAP1 TaxID=237727 RepID=UPI00006875EF|nr:3'(2'),5'-bisphosphate nucleotidase CysQ [Erythrobacter sp. NAP1]EAQ28430.1 putative myo-inositol monophosphatase 2 family protein [Erythrobacter sp. NAP1]